ncbi:uncharacterized protein LOC122305652 isoform X2 [Carya illinoinensis]|uniref:uncharacterized protein LOC122305652 isoform X2 n=1 Tax=Carya illinoinensis TaxID=32201 RepID=UPI001C71FC1C|nr:uncharacterized protein LOC122305652 isoform X2 [Carya illinoinensis]
MIPLLHLVQQMHMGMENILMMKTYPQMRSPSQNKHPFWNMFRRYMLHGVRYDRCTPLIGRHSSERVYMIQRRVAVVVPKSRYGISQMRGSFYKKRSVGYPQMGGSFTKRRSEFKKHFRKISVLLASKISSFCAEDRLKVFHPLLPISVVIGVLQFSPLPADKNIDVFNDQWLSQCS